MAAVEEPPHSPSGCPEMDAIDQQMTALMGVAQQMTALKGASRSLELGPSRQRSRTVRQSCAPIGESLPVRVCY